MSVPAPGTTTFAQLSIVYAGPNTDQGSQTCAGYTAPKNEAEHAISRPTVFKYFMGLDTRGLQGPGGP